MSILSKARDFLADPAHWARGAGDGKTCACIITARSMVVRDEENYSIDELEFVHTAVWEWYDQHPEVQVHPDDKRSIIHFNDVTCPDHATLMQVLNRAVELEAAANA